MTKICKGDCTTEDTWMASKKIKQYLISLAIIEIQTEIAARYHYTSTKTSIIKKTKYRELVRIWRNYILYSRLPGR